MSEALYAAPLLALAAVAVAALAGWRLRAVRRRAQELESSEARYRRLIEDAPYGIYRSDGRRLLFANRALVTMLGYASETELHGIDPERALFGGADDVRQLWPGSASPAPAGATRSFVQQWKRKDGSPISVRVTARALPEPSGPSYEGMVEDVSTRQVLEQQLRHSEKLAALGRLVAGAAHEINNPLTAIMGYAELLSSDPSATPEQRGFAEKIRQQARRTRAITASMQNFSRQQSTAQGGLLDLNVIAANAVRIQQLNSGAARISFEQKLDPRLPRIAGDEYQLLEVCMHILNNSMDALRATNGGAITVRTWSENGTAALEFADTGPGIQDLERAFDPFYTTKPVGEGAGLGLSACYGIVKAHAGSIECRNWDGSSSGGGHGAVVTLKFPAATTAAGAQQQAVAHG